MIRNDKAPLLERGTIGAAVSNALSNAPRERVRDLPSTLDNPP